ncbi:MAG TPA: VWA domain-containing protein [Pyrinomonadaceae bacterium]|nr:VWA domain-containing protein [Pyrinomonadaceae bacterium]
MNLRRNTLAFACLLALLYVAGNTGGAGNSTARAQTTSAVPTPTPKPVPTPEQIKIYTEEVVLPVIATDSNGRFDPTVQADDLLVLEDGQAQTVQNIARMPASVLLLLDTGGFNNPAMKTNATRDFALRLVSNLHAGDQIAAIQFGGKVELIQTWTADMDVATESLRSKIFSGRDGRLAPALSEASVQLRNAPAGNRHIVLVTDGGNVPAEGADLAESIKQLFATQATIHVVSYTSLGRKAIKESQPTVPVRITNEKPKSASDLANELMHPAEAAILEAKNRTKVYVVVDTDYPMWRHNREQLKTLRANEPVLAAIADESGGRMSLPSSVKDLPSICDDLAREIDAQYVITYKPKVAIGSKPTTEVRRIEVVSRRVGLVVHSRRSYFSDVAQ